MTNKKRRYTSTRIVLALLTIMYVASVLWWVSIFSRGIRDVVETYLFNLPMALIPLVGGLYVFFSLLAKKIELPYFLKKTLFFISLAIIFWGMGNVVYLYYNLILNFSTVYLNFPDIIYSIASILWIFGLYCAISFFGKKRLLFVSFWKLCILIFVFMVCSLFLYFLVINDFLFLVPPKELVLGVLYIVPDFIIFFEICFLFYIIFLNKKYHYLKFILPIFIGFCFTYLADVFYLNFRNTFFVASWIDLLFLTGIFFQTVAVLLFFELYSTLLKTKKYEKGIM